MVKKMYDAVKIKVEIDVPRFWIEHPDPKYDEVREKIYTRWALVKYMTGKTAEEWLWKNNSDLYKKSGAIAFLDATKSIEEAIEAILLKRKSAKEL